MCPWPFLRIKLFKDIFFRTAYLSVISPSSCCIEAVLIPLETFVACLPSMESPPEWRARGLAVRVWCGCLKHTSVPALGHVPDLHIGMPCHCRRKALIFVPWAWVGLWRSHRSPGELIKNAGSKSERLSVGWDQTGSPRCPCCWPHGHTQHHWAKALKNFLGTLHPPFAGKQSALGWSFWSAFPLSPLSKLLKTPALVHGPVLTAASPPDLLSSLQHSLQFPRPPPPTATKLGSRKVFQLLPTLLLPPPPPSFLSRDSGLVLSDSSLSWRVGAPTSEAPLSALAQLPAWHLTALGLPNPQAVDFPGGRKEGRDRSRVFPEAIFSIQHPNDSTQLAWEMLGLMEQTAIIKVHFLNCLPLGPVGLAAQ